MHSTHRDQSDSGRGKLTFRVQRIKNCPNTIHPIIQQASKKSTKTKLLGPDIVRWGEGLSREGVGAKRFGMSLEAQGKRTFWRDIPGFCRDILGASEKFEKKVCVQYLAPSKNTVHLNKLF